MALCEVVGDGGRDVMRTSLACEENGVGWVFLRSEH